jgi:hypothetical protein
MDNQIILAPDKIPVLSKENAANFHTAVKERIFETGNGLFEYLETVKFFAAVDKVINGDSASKIQPDKEFIDYTREQIKLNSDKDNFTTGRGVKFTIAETGTSYDFSNCNDPVLVRLEEQAKEAAEKVKQRKEFLKTVDAAIGLVITDTESGETVTVYPPSKTSKSSFKISLPK